MSVIERIPEFATNHPLLVAALAITLAAIAFTEYQRLTRIGTAVQPSRATRLANNEDGVFIDTRARGPYDEAHVPGARSMPADEIDSHLKQLEKISDRPLILYDDGGLDAQKAARKLAANGIRQQLYEIEGGLPAWRKADLPVESGGANKANKGKAKKNKKG